MTRIPEPAPTGPPSPEALSAVLGTGDPGIAALFDKTNARYLYWDDFKHLPMPEGVRPEDAWRVVKALRSLDRKATPVKDKKGVRYTYALNAEVLRGLHGIDMEAGGRLARDGVAIPPDDQGRYLVSSLMEEAIASSQIEGASTTRRVAKDMLRTGRAPETKPERMILNNYRTITALRGSKDEPFTPELIVGLQSMLTEGTLEHPEDVGRFRITDDIIVEGERNIALHVPPLASTIPGELKRLCTFANKSDGAFEHPVIRATILHFWLGYLHPFADGNGRTARAVFYLYMLKHGYRLFEYLSISRVILGRRAQYERAYLYAEHDDADLTYFLLFSVIAIEKAIADLAAYLKTRIEEDRTLRARLQGDRSLNHRQRALLSRALEDPSTVFTIESHQRSHGVSYPTARADMLDLADRGYVSKAKLGRAFTFQAAEGLRGMLG